MNIPSFQRINRLFRHFAAVGLGVTSCALALAATMPLYLDPSEPLEARVEDLLLRLTQEEKIALIHADSKFSTPAIPRLAIPRRWLDDGPLGVREEIEMHTWKPADRTDDFATAMPASIALAATWNPPLARTVGESIGEEARARGKDIMLGPGVNILRTPLCGRNFEYLGEDPYLTGVMAVAYIQGEQAQDVASCLKHFALNNQELARRTINVEVDERTLHEIYLPAFKAAVQNGGALTVMGAYNQVRGQFCCHNDFLLNKVLKQKWGFRGLVMSDWGGVHDTREAALNGLDLEMGTTGEYDHYFLAQPYADGLKKGDFPTAGLDDKVRRNLRVMFSTRVFDGSRKTGSLNTIAHQTTARTVAEEGIVLLKNQHGMLPLFADKIKSIAVIGENATRLHSHGGNSSGIKAFHEITPLDGITKRVGQNMNVIYAEGYRKGGGPDLATRAIEAAKFADVVVYIGGLNHDQGFDCEGADREDMKLPYEQDRLIQSLVAANPRTIVVLEGMMVEMGDWLPQVPAVLQPWYPGMEGGHALARILFGDVNSSAKLPCTFPRRLSDTPTAELGAYPGVGGTVKYDEGLFVGYRWYDAKGIEPEFPFGFGLSYTSFAYSNLRLSSAASGVTVQFEIKNTGAKAGAEVAQLYVHPFTPSVVRPDRELKQFRKIFLQPGEQQTVTITLDHLAFAFYSPEHSSWISEAGNYGIWVGSSSRDLPLRETFKLSQPIVIN